jgi:Putative DNA-binding domain
VDEIRLRSVIDLGECATVEFKKVARDAQGICKEIAAMATSQGGVLLVGVEDDGTVNGLSNAVEVRDRVERWIHESVAPAPVIDIRIVNLDQHDIVAIEIADGLAPFYSSHNISYIRIGTSSQPLKPEQIIDLVRGRPIEDVIRSFESTLAVVQSSLAATQSMAISAQYAVAPAITGQGALATMQYEEVRDRVFSELERAPSIVALRANIAVANSVAALARTAPASAVVGQGVLATMGYDDLIAKLTNDDQLIALMNASKAHAISAFTTAVSAHTSAQAALNEIAQLKARLAALGH